MVQAFGGQIATPATAELTRDPDDVAIDPFGIHLLAHEVTPPTGGRCVQRRGDGAAPTDASVIDAAAHGISNGGTLPFREEMESSFGVDFSGVRVHSGAQAAAASQAIGAEAYTMGDDIVLGTAATPELIAHELAHVVQQRAGTGPSGGVGQVGDPFEREADAAAAAVAAGRPVELACAAGAQPSAIQRRAVQRSETAETLPQQVAQQQAWASRATDAGVTWGGANTTEIDPDTGEAHARDSEIMRNAARHGMQDQLQGLSLEIDQVKPLLRAWMMAATTCNSIERTEGIDLNHPRSYARELKTTMGAQMQNTRNPVAKQMRDELRGSSSQAMQAATSRLSGSIQRLQNAQRALERLRGRLEQARLSREIASNQETLGQINEKIATIATVITTVARLAAMAAGAAAAASSSLAGASLAPAEETFGSAVPGAAPYGHAGSIQSGADAVAGAGNVIETVLRATVFAREIESVNSRIATLNGAIGDLQTHDVKLEVDQVTTHLGIASTEYQAASHEAGNTQQNFFNAMRMAGRTYDQQGMTESQALASEGTSVRDGNTVSMEALMSLVSSLQSRRAARSAFGALVQGSAHLRQAPRIMARSLENDRAGLVKLGTGQTVLGKVDIDLSQPEHGWNPGVALQLEGGSLRQTVDTITIAIARYDQLHESQSATEDQWLQIMSAATSQLVH